MKPAARLLLFLYVLVAVLDVFLIIQRREDLRWFSKPLLLPVLIMLYHQVAGRTKNGTSFLILGALFLSWCGDVLLLAKSFFILGLVSFLLAHVAYIVYFIQKDKRTKGLVQKKPLVGVPAGLYVASLLTWLYPYLHELKIPVIFYGLAIGTMLLMALNTKNRVAEKPAWLFIFGAVLFVLSDSLLAINLFARKNDWFGPLVMVSYAAAQCLIVFGASAADADRLPNRAEREVVIQPLEQS